MRFTNVLLACITTILAILVFKKESTTVDPSQIGYTFYQSTTNGTSTEPPLAGPAVPFNPYPTNPTYPTWNHPYNMCGVKY